MTSQHDESWLLLTNDDGIEAIGLELLVKTLNSRGHKVIVFAPQENHSAAGMKINLMKEIKWRFRTDLVERWQLENHNIIHLLELEGSPCDTMIVSLDGGLKHILPECSPCLVVSGVNLGPNMSQDSYHSGTMGAAREAGLYGMPAIASSLTSFEGDGMQVAVDATVKLIEKVLENLPSQAKNVRRTQLSLDLDYLSSWPNSESKDISDLSNACSRAFFAGDLMLNINTPPNWNGKFTSTRLGMRWYRDAIKISQSRDEDNTATFTIGAASIDHTPVEKSDCDAVDAGYSSITCMPTWPQSHPLNVDESLIAYGLQENNGFPIWL